ncbi:Acetoacetyl-CoA synthetase [Choanephora cucurbitarum]|uniref:Acetoacetyl-CoA synthetase n=1 Tax=Choanephora cucurbitarum TaxID=101091 RepID=A0A1C7NDX6_9FUNG|nr:Acetoacetyl-CoA synthetase [Choanephora cucurbitarum]
MTADLVSEKALTTEPQCLWTPSNVQDTHMEKFRLLIKDKYKDASIADYQQLWKWSVDYPELFWSEVWDYTQIVSSKKGEHVINKDVLMDNIPAWFEESRLNFAENLLWCRDAKKTAIIATGEGHSRRSISYEDLYNHVLKFAEALKSIGIKKGDRVAAYIPNCAEAVVAMLATTSIGALWSSTSPDFGTTGVLDRFSQIQPKVLISVNKVIYNGKQLDHMTKLTTVAKGLPSVEKVVLIPFVGELEPEKYDISNLISWDDFLNSVPVDKLPSQIQFAQVSFDHPAFVLFSSGTTGLPKCIVHSGGRLLLQLKKEHIIHGNMGPDDVFFYYTTTGWMMWNWLTAGLSVGATIVLWDGSPFKPAPISLWELSDELGVTHFGTSAKYIQSLEEVGVHPMELCRLNSIKAIYSTGSPLKPESFDFVYNHIKKDVMLGSITGGTDICSLFAGHNAALPVYRGEIQCICLGMNIQAWDEYQKPVYGCPADLVCVTPFPCMPIEMYGDGPDRPKYKSAYFDVYPHVWYHGDFVWINPKTGGVIMLGRSDGTLNPNGVRFGSAEIYNVVDKFNSDGGVEDTLCVGQKIKGEDDERVILFLKLKDGHNTVSEEFVKKLKTTIRNELSPRHVPAFILPIADIPYTINGKKVEVAVKKILSGQSVKATGTLANPESLELYYNIPELAQ